MNTPESFESEIPKMAQGDEISEAEAKEMEDRAREGAGFGVNDPDAAGND